ncbi:MAG: thrombospondin type 3 repeat-containing protein [Planctomycetota bacterium]
MKKTKSLRAVSVFAISTALLLGLVHGCMDADNDGILDQEDNCPAVANPDQADSDGNGVGDACEGSTSPLPDKDGDGFVDTSDNCPSNPNADQADGDSDGIGDVCDNCPSAPTIDQADSDGDGIGDACDNCPNTSSTDQADTDGDGLGNACDPCPENIDHSDSDSDGIPDCAGVSVIDSMKHLDSSIKIQYGRAISPESLRPSLRPTESEGESDDELNPTAMVIPDYYVQELDPQGVPDSAWAKLSVICDPRVSVDDDSILEINPRSLNPRTKYRLMVRNVRDINDSPMPDIDTEFTTPVRSPYDPTMPAITYSSIPFGAMDSTIIDSVISLRFESPLVAEYVDNQAIQLKTHRLNLPDDITQEELELMVFDGYQPEFITETIPITVEMDDDEKGLSLIPNTPLESNTLYSAYMNPDVFGPVSSNIIQKAGDIPDWLLKLVIQWIKVVLTMDEPPPPDPAEPSFRVKSVNVTPTKDGLVDRSCNIEVEFEGGDLDIEYLRERGFWGLVVYEHYSIFETQNMVWGGHNGGVLRFNPSEPRKVTLEIPSLALLRGATTYTVRVMLARSTYDYGEQLIETRWESTFRTKNPGIQVKITKLAILENYDTCFMFDCFWVNTDLQVTTLITDGNKKQKGELGEYEQLDRYDGPFPGMCCNYVTVEEAKQSVFITDEVKKHLAVYISAFDVDSANTMSSIINGIAGAAEGVAELVKPTSPKVSKAFEIAAKVGEALAKILPENENDKITEWAAIWEEKDRWGANLDLRSPGYGEFMKSGDLLFKIEVTEFPKTGPR